MQDELKPMIEAGTQRANEYNKRYEDQIDWYDKKAKLNERIFQGLGLSSLSYWVP